MTRKVDTKFTLNSRNPLYFLPPIILIKTTIIAIIIRICIKPPIVYELTIPKSHNIIRIIASISNILSPPLKFNINHLHFFLIYLPLFYKLVPVYLFYPDIIFLYLLDFLLHISLTISFPSPLTL